MNSQLGYSNTCPLNAFTVSQTYSETQIMGYSTPIITLKATLDGWYILEKMGRKFMYLRSFKGFCPGSTKWKKELSKLIIKKIIKVLSNIFTSNPKLGKPSLKNLTEARLKQKVDLVLAKKLVQKIEENLFTVEGITSKETRFVSLLKLQGECSCEGYLFNGRTCYHILAVQQFFLSKNTLVKIT